MFYVLSITNCVIVNVDMPTNSFGNILITGIPGQIIFLYLGFCIFLFPYWIYKLYSHRHYVRIAFFPYTYQHLSLWFLTIAILTRVRCNLNVVFIYISLIAIDEHFIKYLLTICSSFQKYLFNSFFDLLIRLFWCFVLLIYFKYYSSVRRVVKISPIL